VFTHLVVREDAHALFGFQSLSERDLFRSLIKVAGIGPKLPDCCRAWTCGIRALRRDGDVTRLTLRNRSEDPERLRWSSRIGSIGCHGARPHGGAIEMLFAGDRRRGERAVMALGYRPVGKRSGGRCARKGRSMEAPRAAPERIAPGGLSTR
jgi:hypothetical protein